MKSWYPISAGSGFPFSHFIPPRPIATDFNRKIILIIPNMRRLLIFFPALLFLLIGICGWSHARPACAHLPANPGQRPGIGSFGWKAGIGRRIITPPTDVWLAGYGARRAPEGKLHDIWVKVLALQAPGGKRAVLITTDHQGMSKTIYQRLYEKIRKRFRLKQSEVMLTFSHNHSGPCLQDDLVDYYPSDEAQRKLVYEYSLWMEEEIMTAIESALKDLQPARLSKGEGHCTFAVNRRENKEAEVPQLMAAGTPLKGPVDYSVPVLAVKGTDGNLMGILFGYACHPTTLNHNLWSGDYPGYAQLYLEQQFPGATAMFFNTCGGDQNPIPRRTVELCEKYGKMLSNAVAKQLMTDLREVSPRIRTAFQYVNLDYLEVVTREKLLPVARSGNEIQARWANRMLKQMDEGIQFPSGYDYPVQAWQLGSELTLIGIGGEAVVDYALNFKKEFGRENTWVSGYTNEMAAYIPSRRVWEEGGYEGGSHLDEYGRPAWRWAGNIEDRITQTTRKLVKRVRSKKN